MKITVYYEDNRARTTIEVPDEDCEIWVESDYRRRLTAAKDGETVTRRTAQQIMDEEFNKPTYNRHHAETRRHVSLDAYDPMGDTLPAERDDLERFLRQYDYEELHRAIRSLKPRQQELLHDIYWKGMSQAEVARRDGVSEASVSQRMGVILAKLRKMLEK